MRWAAPLTILLLIICTGCSVSPGGGFTLFPSGHFLLSTTRDVAAAAPRPAMVPRELQKMAVPAYYVEPGDVLLVEPAAFDSVLRFPSDQTVLVDGTIDLGRYGRPVVAGLTLEQIEQNVELAIAAVEAEAEPVNVRLIEPRGAVYYVLGEVNAPGAYPLDGRETVLDAIMSAGGLTDRASPCDLVLSRPTPPMSCRIVLPVCYRQITQLGDTSTNYQVMPGDRIYVGTRTLLEDLLPWSAYKPCSLCDALQCPCPEPDAGLYRPETPFLPPVEEPLDWEHDEPVISH